MYSLFCLPLQFLLRIQIESKLIVQLMHLDPHFAIPYSLDRLSPTKGLVVTLEDSLFQETDDGRLSTSIDDWSVNKIKRMGGDAVKVLAW